MSVYLMDVGVYAAAPEYLNSGASIYMDGSQASNSVYYFTDNEEAPISEPVHSDTSIYYSNTERLSDISDVFTDSKLVEAHSARSRSALLGPQPSMIQQSFQLDSAVTTNYVTAGIAFTDSSPNTLDDFVAVEPAFSEVRAQNFEELTHISDVPSCRSAYY